MVPPTGLPSTALFFTYALATSLASAACPDDRYVQENVMVTVQPGARDSCYVSVDPVDFNNGITRSYMFDNDGGLMIFDSYVNSESEADTGARVLYFFPVEKKASYSSDQKFVRIHTAAENLNFHFASKSQRLEDIDGIVANIDHDIRPENQGGLSITSSKYTYLDCGYRRGGDPRSRRSASCRFFRPDGRQCVLTNSSVFRFLEGGDVEPRWKSGGINAFLRRHCDWEH